ncbi:hypothetical protein DB30_04669 [Enhygromyxa salina]|uniref:Uncharacterized protein n=1 Tax=Enhygromyxa salina TaxID=215803 RepID=A0A0C1ZP05_9BACT|nr:hypothetical protein DB30_04669 [Enhygromyxa salina]
MFLWLVAVVGCADRAIGGGDELSVDGPPPGELYGECMDASDCFDEWCVHPASEPGFCTYPCAQGCETELGGNTTCLTVDGEGVCALDCGANGSCPAGMRCEKIESGGDPRSICF